MKKLGLLAVLLLFVSIGFSQETEKMEGITGEGKTKDGHKVGKWKYTCDATGKEVGRESYDGKGLLDGFCTMSDCEGNVLYEYNYDSGRKMGKQKEYYPFAKHLRKEWSMVKSPKECGKDKKDGTEPEYYKEWYESGKLMIEWVGKPCGERIITKYRPTNGTEWIIKYDIHGKYKFGPRDQERAINNEDLR